MQAQTPELIETLAAFTRSQNATKSVLALAPHSEIKIRIREHRNRSALNLNQCGPKRKAVSGMVRGSEQKAAWE